MCSTYFEWGEGKGHTVRKRGRRRRGTLLEKKRKDKEEHTFIKRIGRKRRGALLEKVRKEKEGDSVRKGEN